ncbi:MAG: hypothetical protein NTV23_01270 [Propionibacteriales bacterium]|nr:hypothetical protein [Propionibacteriales bacterium]
MAVTPMSPGEMLDGRYRLEVLLSEHGGARFWRATDTVLARSVAVHVVPSDDPRSPRVLEAARSSAAVSDPHFLRVLDCADADGLTWVINEWGDGVSLDVMLARGTLPAMRAAWLTREVAEAIVAAHAQGLCHGRLNPEAVLVTESGAVKLIGFVVNAAFERTPAPARFYGDISPRESDVVDLAGLLYAALTGKWPGVSPSGVPAAPRDGSKPMRPRQVRAGVPRDLDAICDRVLNKEASQHTLPIETALEVAAALSDYVGDPALVAPVDAPSMHDEPEPPGTLRPADPEPAEPEPAVTPPDPEPADPEPADPEPAVTPADPEDTMAAPPPFAASGFDFFEPEPWEPATPLPPFEQPAERPLFADQERRVPAAAPAAGPAPAVPTEPGTEAEPAPTAPGPRRRTWLRRLLVITFAVGLAVAMYLAFEAGKDDEPTTPGASSTPSPSGAPGSPAASAPATPTGPVVTISAVADFDPEGDPQAENPGRARLAIDGDPGTAWPTAFYPDANFGAQVSGVGLILDLGAEKAVSSIVVQLIGAPTDVRVYAGAPGAGTPPAELADTVELGRVPAAGTTATLEFPAARTRYLVVWLTRLPADGARYRGQIAGITVRS